jgi:hypothetical protein
VELEPENEHGESGEDDGKGRMGMEEGEHERGIDKENKQKNQMNRG